MGISVAYNYDRIRSYQKGLGVVDRCIERCIQRPCGGFRHHSPGFPKRGVLAIQAKKQLWGYPYSWWLPYGTILHFATSPLF